VCFLPGAEQFLQQMRKQGKRLMLLTNAHHDSLRVKCATTGLDRYFDALISSHSLGYPKEDPHFWPAVQLQQQIDFSRALFVDDSLAVLQAARRHGLAHVLAVSKPDSTLPGRDMGEFPSVESVWHLIP
jgi:5'-nucleotidase